MSLFTSLVDYSLYFIKVLVPRGPEEKCPFPTLSLQNVAPGSWGSKVGDVLFGQQGREADGHSPSHLRWRSPVT